MFARPHVFCLSARAKASQLGKALAAGEKVPTPSRVGRTPVSVPEGVSVHVGTGAVTVTGPLGSITRTVPGLVRVERAQVEDARAVKVERTTYTKDAQALQGTFRQHVKNMVEGVTAGFTRHLVLKGVGYRANIDNGTLHLNLGIKRQYPIPPGVNVSVAGSTNILINGIDIESVTQTAAKIRSFQPPDPYKGKGVRYYDEVPKLRSPKGKK